MWWSSFFKKKKNMTFITKSILSVLTVSTLSFNTSAQSFTDNLLGTNATNARSAISADIDSDGDLDILIASQGNSEVAWYENTDGLGTFSAKKIIGNVNNTYSAVAGDLDGDGDLDVVASSNGLDRIVWFENTDGQGTFGVAQTVTLLTDGATEVAISDINGDGFLDIISASYLDDKIAYYQNDGTGVFGPQNVVATPNGAISVYAADMDGDGDMDILSAASLFNRIGWSENTGGGSFAAIVYISTTANGASSVSATDMDGDGDLDVLFSAASGNKVAWHENTDGNGTFGPEKIINSTVNNAFRVSAADLDNDGDMDVISASFNDDQIAWYKNTDGQGTFGPAIIISNVAQGASFVSTGDLDGDGGIDVLSASYNDNSVNWYQNDIALGLSNYKDINISIFPNPVTTTVTINTQNKIENINMIDLSGQTLAVNLSNNSINVSHLSAGVYILQVQTEKGIYKFKLIKK